MAVRRRLDALLAALALAVVVLGVGGCVSSVGEGDPSPNGLEVTASILPQQYFIDRIGGEHVSVNVMVLPGANPATYEPKPEQLKALSQSAAYFSIGVPFESVWLTRIAAANPEMQLVDTIAGIDRVPMADHEHGDEEEHEAGAPDPHVWVSPALVRIQAETIAEALVALDPQHEADYRANLDLFLSDITAMEADLRETLAGVTRRTFLVFHPSWGYFADDFGLQQIAIEVGGQEPSAQELASIISEAKAEGVRVVFAQPEFSTADAETIAAEIGGEVLLISPLAYDWLGNMREVAATFAEALGRD